MRKHYDFVADPGHGWLKVKLAELDQLGITNLISNYSYVRGDTAYLEEDADLALFLEAKQEKQGLSRDDLTIRVCASNRSSRVRGYAMFGGDRMVTRINAMTGQEFQERADTPYCASARSETYWAS